MIDSRGVSVAPDVVYVVRPGDSNPELRWSLRTLVNLPHGTVWLAGHRPRWVRGNVRHLPTEQREVVDTATKRDNAWVNLRAAVECDDVSGRFTYMDDDYFILTRHDRAPVVHRGPLAAHVEDYTARYPDSAYTRLLAHTFDTLRSLGVDEPLSYDLHVPLEVDRAALARVMRICDEHTIGEGRAKTRPAWRSVYGNLMDLRGEMVEDCKAYRDDSPPCGRGIVSTSDGTWRTWGRAYVGARFPTRCRYEGG